MFLGTNLAEIGYSDSNVPFLNIMKTGSGWFAGNADNAGLNAALDANGYPTDTVSFTYAATSVLKDIRADASNRTYQGANGTTSGCYVFLYDGTGTFSFNNEFVKVAETAQNGSAGTGRIVLTATPPTNGSNSGGTDIIVTASSGGTYAKNFRLVYCPTVTTSNYTTTIDPRETAVTAAEAGDYSKAFNPDFLTRDRSFKMFRFMTWNSTYENNNVDWANRCPPGWCFFHDPRRPGREIPYEYQIALCNLVGADAWINLPVCCTDAFATSLGNLLLSTLRADLTVGTEFGNELWLWPGGYSNDNGTSTKFTDIAKATGYFAGGLQDQQYAHAYGAARQYQTNKIIHDIFVAAGQGSRHKRILADASGTGSWSFTVAATTTDFGYSGPNGWSGHLGSCPTNFDVHAGSMYFNNYHYYPTAWGGMGQAGFDNAFQAMLSGGFADGSTAVTTAGPRNAQTVAAGPGTVQNGTLICVNFNQGGQVAVTITTGNPLIASTAHNLTAGATVFLHSDTGGGLGTAFAENTPYYVIATGLVANGFELAATLGGTAITPTGTITGPVTGFVATTLTANDGTPYPVCDQLGNIVAINSGAINLAWTNLTIDGTPTNIGWYMWGLQPVGGELKEMHDLCVAAKVFTDAEGAEFWGYEGGQQLSTGGAGGPGGEQHLAHFYTALNRNAGMGTAYTAWLADCVSIGFTRLMSFNDIQEYGNFGNWGALENVLQTTSPKNEALMRFLGLRNRFASFMFHG